MRTLKDLVYEYAPNCEFGENLVERFGNCLINNEVTITGPDGFTICFNIEVFGQHNNLFTRGKFICEPEGYQQHYLYLFKEV